MTPMMRQILFVCTGNICRSPMAEALLRAALPKGAGWHVTSAGTNTVDDFGASAHAVSVMAEKGVDLTPHRSQSLSRELVSRSDIIVTMTEGHTRQVGERFPDSRDRIHLMRSFDPDAPPQSDVCDPFGGTLEDYRNCLAHLRKAIPGLLKCLEDRIGE